jgi:hypothetical protein
MTRARLALAATLVTTAFAGSVLGQTAQTPPAQAPPMKSVLAGKKLTPPIKGEAALEYTTPVVKREKDMVVTRITVRNTALAPIPRLTIDQTWYDKGGAVVVSSRGTVAGLLQPGEVKTVVIETPYDAKLNSNQYMFQHANGSVKPTRVPKIEVPKDPATAPAGATKKP